MKKYIIYIFSIFCLLIAFYPSVLQHIANNLVVQDKLERSDVVMVLAGDSNGERVAQAVDLYKKGWAPKILMSGGPAVWSLTYAENMKNQAKYLGVPDKDILIQDKSESTIEDILFSLQILKKMNIKKLILVSSPYHMRRMVSVARKMYRLGGIKIIAYPTQKTKWDSKNWWLRHEDTQPVIYEYMAIIQYLLKGWML